MTIKEKIRPGGRSARVQASVHQAVRDLLAEKDRAEVTVPMIAARAGVTPSTIYRRWGDVQDLFADVAVARLKSDATPTDTGTVKGDLETWLEQFAEEMSSTPGRAMIRDVLASSGDTSGPAQCCEYTRQQLALIVDRAKTRGERAPAVEDLMDHVIAPIMYRILFGGPLGSDYCRSLVRRVLPG